MFYPSCLHTHTQFCDGRSTMRAIAARAASLGFTSLGFSPHSPLPYANDWAMREEDLPLYLKEIERLKEKYRGRMEICAGIELDADTPVCPDGLDFVIGAVHSLVKDGERFAVDYREDLLRDVTDRLYNGDFLALCRDYYDAVARAALRPGITILAHFDLVVKYNRDSRFVDENDPRYLESALDTVDRITKARGDLIFEINTGGMARAGRPYPYPAPPILRALNERGARFIVTCDCHRAALLGVGYDAAKERLDALSSPRLLIREDGKFRPYPAGR